MGKSRFEGMEIAIREQAKISESSASDKAQIDRLKAELESIDADSKQRIAEIKAAPVNKDLLRQQAENDFNAKLQRSKRECDKLVTDAEHEIQQAEFNAENEYKQAKLNITRRKESLVNVKETALEMKKQLDVNAKQEYEVFLASIDNTEKTLALRIQKEDASTQKARRELDIKLRALQSRDNIVEEQKNGWKRFYDDVVEISKQPPTE